MGNLVAVRFSVNVAKGLHIREAISRYCPLRRAIQQVRPPLPVNMAVLPAEPIARFAIYSRPKHLAEPLMKLVRRFKGLAPADRPQDPFFDGTTLRFEVIEHGGEYDDAMPQAIR